MKNWVNRKLDEVCELITCGVAARPEYVEDGIPFLSAKNVKEGQIIWSGYNYISEKTHKELTKNNKPLLGDILYTRVGSYGEAAVVEDDYEFSVFVSLTLIKVDKKVLNNYFLKHYLNSDFVKRLAKKSISGSGVGNLNVGTVREFPILLPPLPEQERIVSIIDEAFAAIAKAKSNAEQNLKNAKELFESYLQGVFENKGEEWDEKNLGEIGRPSMCKRILKHQTSTTGEIPFYKIGTFGKKPDAFISKEIYDEFRAKYSFPKNGDILISASGTIGRRVRYDGKPAYFQDSNIVWIDNDEKQVLNDYLYVFYEFCDWQPSKGATISRLYNSNLTSIKIIFPKSLEEQRNILKKINSISTETQKLESIYQQKMNDLEELKKSILQKAFSGDLKTSTAVA
jgi:type I restriction enzyme S subunit